MKESVVREEVHCITRELNELVDSLKQKSGEYVWGWILRVWDNGGRNIQRDQDEFIEMGPLSGDSGFNMETHTLFLSVKGLNGWLKHLPKDGLLKKRWRCLISLVLVLIKLEWVHCEI